MTMKIKRYIQLVMLCITLCLLCQCTTTTSSESTYSRDGKVYGKTHGAFRHRWWNFYERGISFADGKFFSEAEADFKEAVHQREKDQRMARTYGMHFVDYFPHRELGIVYYETGNMVRAKDELESSLKSFPSAKAYFYLDRVRKALIEQSKVQIFPPTLILGFKTRNIWTRADPVIISGTASDENYIAGVTIKGMPVFLESAQKKLPFKKPLNLAQGTHVIKVAARNLPGKTTAQEITIHVDREGPVLSLNRLDVGNAASGRKVIVSGWIHDAAGVSALSVNGRRHLITKGINVPFKVETIIQGDRLELASLDTLKNKTTASIPLDFKASRLSPVLLASADPFPKGLLAANIFGSPKDSRPPVIAIKDWTDHQTVFLDKYYIEGRVSDENNIQALTVNKVPIRVQKGCYVFFSHMQQLVEGKNILTIEATDQFGNTAQKIITIFRKIPAAQSLKQRLSLSTCPFEQKGAVSGNSIAFLDNLVDSFVNQKRFKMVERSKLALVLQEQKLSQTALFDRDTAVKLGGLIGAQSIVTGSIIETRNGLEVVSRLIDTETSDILSTQDVYSEAKDLLALHLLAQGMAVKFTRDFPLTAGQVLSINGHSIATDMGVDTIKLQRRLIIFRNEPTTQALTGKPLGSENKILGYARVNQVMPGLSKAECFNAETNQIKPLDKVIVQ